MKTIRIICIALIGLVMISCNKTGVEIENDFVCETSYQLENKTDETIVIEWIYEHYETITTIPPSTTKEIYKLSDICGKNTMVEEMDFDGEVLPIGYRSTVDIYADNKLVNNTLLDKPNWSFSATEYYKATCLLVVTDELIESVGYKSE